MALVESDVVLSRRSLRVLTNSAVTCFRRCPREYKHAYVDLRRPHLREEPLRFGSLVHTGYASGWEAGQVGPVWLEAAIAAMRNEADGDPEISPFELVKAEELLLGYAARWADEPWEAVSVEGEATVPLVNPDTGAASRTFEVTAKWDGIVRHLEVDTLKQLELKTTVADVGAGSDYWRPIQSLDPQVSTYQMAAKASGYQLDGCLYDVIRKPGLRPLKATPEESRKYTKAGLLYANQREHDETPEEYRARLREDISGNPERYYARADVVRLEADAEEAARDLWHTADVMRMSENAGRFPRSPNACKRFGRFCAYFDVCSGVASIDDDDRFRTAVQAHEELEGKEV